MPRGSVLELYRWPVKSMAGERLDALDVGEHGVAGDRRHAVWLRGGRRLTARVAPRMLAWSAALDGGPLPRVTAPDGREFAWDDEALEAELGTYLERDVALVADPHGLQDVQGTLLVTVEASRRALEDELGGAVDIRRFRPNLHVDLDAAPFAEAGWEGRTLRVGGVELEVAHPCDRCAITIHDPETRAIWPDLLRRINEHHDTFFGFRARALGAGTIAPGDPVEGPWT